MTAISTASTTHPGIHVSAEFDSVMARLDEITALLQQNAEQGEEQGTLTDEVVRALHDTGVFRIGIPHELGGYEF